jgi:hypothetical protein
VRGARLGAAALVCFAVAAFLLLRRGEHETRPAASEAAPASPTAAPTAAAQPSADTPPPPAAPPPRTRLDAPALASPQSAVQTALRLLDSGDLDLFRETFLPSVQPQVTPDAFAACRRRVRQAPVRPDWEVAEESTSAGHRVVRVSIFGKSMTGFHDVDGRWLADALWCLPVGLP